LGIDYEYHFGGYAKVNPVLIQFINQFYAENKIPLDPIYTVRWFWRFRFDSENYFRAGSKILLIHTVDFKDSRNEYEIKNKHLPTINNND
jgi:1-aminocyclopropane-1-carboxylate deaminase